MFAFVLAHHVFSHHAEFARECGLPVGLDQDILLARAARFEPQGVFHVGSNQEISTPVNELYFDRQVRIGARGVVASV